MASVQIRFSRTIGQSGARSALTTALVSDTVPHAMLVYGGRGLGQCAMLLDICDILLCESTEIRPCGTCRGCRERLAHSRNNVISIFPLETAQHKSQDTRDEAVNRKLEILEKCPYGLFLGDKEHIAIDQIRALRQRLSYTEEQTRVRIILIFWAESMPAPAANALLKILEEPPRNTYFLLACENRSQLMATILSRCIKLGLQPLNTTELLAAGEKLREWSDEETSPLLATLSEGSPGVYLELLQDGGESLLSAASAFLEAALSPEWMTFAEWVESTPHGQEMESCLRLLEFTLRMVRVWHRMQAAAPRSPEDWVAQGFSQDLEPHLLIFRRLSDLNSLVRFLENTAAAVRHYAKPSMSLIGNHLEFQLNAQFANA